jgi:hypothetical protein
MIMHKKYLSLLIFTLALSAESSQLNTQMTNPLMELIVHKTPTCGCCKMWVNHMENNGFAINTQDHQSLLKIKDNLKIEPQFRSCHTAVSSEGYFFEGHIPGKYVSKFLKESNPKAIGLSVPGMPLGSPGMEVEGRFTPYDVLIHFRDGTTKVYAEVRE